MYLVCGDCKNENELKKKKKKIGKELRKLKINKYVISLKKGKNLLETLLYAPAETEKKQYFHF